jgi:hypothetical protein
MRERLEITHALWCDELNAGEIIKNWRYQKRAQPRRLRKPELASFDVLKDAGR